MVVVSPTEVGTEAANLESPFSGRPLSTRTGSQRLRTAAEVLIEVELRRPVRIPVYQSIAPAVAEMHSWGLTLKAIGEHFGVDDHTAAKALRWHRSC